MKERHVREWFKRLRNNNRKAKKPKVKKLLVIEPTPDKLLPEEER